MDHTRVKTFIYLLHQLHCDYIIIQDIQQRKHFLKLFLHVITNDE